MQTQRGAADEDWITRAMQQTSSSQQQIRNILQKFHLTDFFLSYQTHIKYLRSRRTLEVTTAHQVGLRAQFCFLFPQLKICHQPAAEMDCRPYI